MALENGNVRIRALDFGECCVEVFQKSCVSLGNPKPTKTTHHVAVGINGVFKGVSGDNTRHII